MWAADSQTGFGGGTDAYYTVYDPLTGVFTDRKTNGLGANLFCPGTTNLSDGRVMVEGGTSAGSTSIYDPSSTNDIKWSAGANLTIPRAYNANTLLQDGSVFTIGGSWAGGQGGKNGEVWTQAGGWKGLSGALVASLEGTDPGGVYRGDNHMWLLPTGNGRVLHAGPSVNMHWIDTRGAGAVTDAGTRLDDPYSMSGSAVMYDTGKILKLGGAPAYQNMNATNTAYLMDVNTGLTVKKVSAMTYARGFQNSVVLPNGQVVVIGGESLPVPFSDESSALVPELFDPATETFTALPAMNIPRNYHSVALLLPDATVMSAGGNLGSGNAHLNMQILRPHYLFNADGSAADRPAITGSPASVNYGATAGVTTNGEVTSFALVRASSNTHGVNNDQRRLSLTFTNNGSNNYSLNIPTNPGWALPGYYMLFALNARGVPSMAKMVKLSNDQAPQITPFDDQTSGVGEAPTLNVNSSAPTGGGALGYTAEGLPPGVTLNAATGVFQGAPTTVGRYLVKPSVKNGIHTVSTQFVWSVTATPTAAYRYVMLKAITEASGNPWTSMAEFYLLDGAYNDLARTGWANTITADSQQAGNEVKFAVDGDAGTFWHTFYSTGSGVTALPHWIKLDLGVAKKLGGFRYQQRSDGSPNGNIGKFNFYGSGDGSTWTQLTDGDMANYPLVAGARTIKFATGAPAISSNSFNYVKLEALSEINGNAWTSAAEFNVLGTDGINLDRTGWTASADSAEVTKQNGVAANVLDGNPDTFWHTEWSPDTPMPHALVVNMAGTRSVGGFRYLPRSDGSANGTIATFNFYASTDGVSWVKLLSSAKMADYPAAANGERTVMLVPAISPPTLFAPAAQTGLQGQATSLSLLGSDPQGGALTYSATGLPPGLTLQTATGVISGTASTSGTYTVGVLVSNVKGLTASASFVWTVQSLPATIAPVPAPQASTNTAVAYAATATGNTLQYSWSFGDKTPDSAFSASNTVNHSYAAAGLYTITLTVKDASGKLTVSIFYQAVTDKLPASIGKATASTNLLFEPRAGSNARVWVVNQDNNSVTVFNATNDTRIAEITVGERPRSIALSPTTGRLWVVNKGDASVTLIDPGNLNVLQTVALPRGSQPFGLVFDKNGNAFVTLEALGQVIRLSSAGVLGAALNVGPNPRHIALTPDGSKLLVSRFITPPLPGEGTKVVSTTLNSVKVGGEVVVLDAAKFTVAKASLVLQHSDKTDSENSGRGFPNYLGAAAISPDGKTAWVPSKQDNILRGTLRDQKPLDFQNTVRAISSRIDLGTLTEDYAARIDHDNSSLASAALHHPGGAYLFVALETSRQIAVVDAIGKKLLFNLNTGFAPQGLAFSADGRKLYVNNFMDRSVGVYDLASLLDFGQIAKVPDATVVSSITFEKKLTSQELVGKKLFYDAKDTRLARDSYMSCASCHNDGSHDGRTWDFTGFGEGLRNTIALRGRAGAQGNKHWTGNFDEIQDFEGQIRTFAGGTGLMAKSDYDFGTRNTPLGTPKAGVSADLDALAAYVISLNTFDVSPLRKSDGTLTNQAFSGKTIFSVQCLSCHGGNDFTNSAGGLFFNVGTIKQPTSGQRLGVALTGLDTPTLRDAWATAPYLHNGSAPTVADAVKAHTNLALSAWDLDAVSAFVQQIGRDEPGLVPSVSARYVKFEATSEVNGNPWTSMAEFNLLSATKTVLSRTGWKASADSAESNVYNGAVANVLDGDVNTFWHTQWSQANPKPLHWIVVDLGSTKQFSGFRYTPRPNSTGSNGTVAKYNFYTSPDNIRWTLFSSGDLTALGASTDVKDVMLK